VRYIVPLGDMSGAQVLAKTDQDSFATRLLQLKKAAIDNAKTRV
jgi:hypothetical protein